MRFRQYSDNGSTVKEWARQLNIVVGGQYRLYSTIDNTLSHWKDELNKNLNTNTFSIKGSNKATLQNWQEILNNLYDK